MLTIWFSIANRKCFGRSWSVLDYPSPPSLPLLVDQFEELLKRFPVQALDWANTLTNQHTRDNLARVIFVLEFGRWLSDLAQFEPRHSL